MVVISLHLLHTYPPPNLTLPIPTNVKKTCQYTPLTSNIKNTPLWHVFDVWWQNPIQLPVDSLDYLR